MSELDLNPTDIYEGGHGGYTPPEELATSTTSLHGVESQVLRVSQERKSKKSGSESPPYGSPTSFQIPRIRHSQLDDTYEEMAGTLLMQETVQAQIANEISAPYEVPQFPIEQIETKLALQRQLSIRHKDSEARSQTYEPSIGPALDEVEGASSSKIDYDLDPPFQRVSISGEDTSGVPYEDLVHASKFLVNALRLRESYMAKSRQSFPNITSRFLNAVDHAGDVPKEVHHDDKKTIDDIPADELVVLLQNNFESTDASEKLLDMQMHGVSNATLKPSTTVVTPAESKVSNVVKIMKNIRKDPTKQSKVRKTLHELMHPPHIVKRKSEEFDSDTDLPLKSEESQTNIEDEGTDPNRSSVDPKYDPDYHESGTKLPRATMAFTKKGFNGTVVVLSYNRSTEQS